jgi:hypothetical protein
MPYVREKLKLLLPLLACVFLGFYVYGVILGVFSPLELIGFTIIAAVCTFGVLGWTIALRRGWSELAEPTPEEARARRARRERRGF